MPELTDPELTDLVGKTLREVTSTDEAVHFVTDDDRHYALTHHQDCCESVYVEDVCGDLSDLVGSPILVAEETISMGEHPPEVKVPEHQGESFTWTFYKFATIKGTVTIRFYGESNGYYSESVHFKSLKSKRL